MCLRPNKPSLICERHPTRFFAKELRPKRFRGTICSNALKERFSKVLLLRKFTHRKPTSFKISYFLIKWKHASFRLTACLCLPWWSESAMENKHNVTPSFSQKLARKCPERMSKPSRKVILEESGFLLTPAHTIYVFRLSIDPVRAQEPKAPWSVSSPWPKLFLALFRNVRE